MSPAQRSTEEALDAVLTSADELFYREGITAVTMADIRDRSGIAFRRLYSLFPHKSDLVAGWLAHRHQSWMAMFDAGIQQHTERGAAPVDAVFDSLEEWLLATNFRGCGFINTLAEVGEVTEEHRGIIRAHKHALVEYLGRFSEAADALAVVVDGAIVQAAVFASIEPVRAARDAAAALFTLQSESDKS